MLDLFKGEFFIHPAALDYSGNTCSNACAYCFASMRSEDRRASVKKLIDLCLGKASGRTLADWLFNQGYPVCISNRSDPFATSNRDNTPQILQAMDLVPNGVFFQTKGLSKGVDFSMLDGFKKKNVVMYITIDTISDEICRRIEPGAPLPDARLELAKYAKARGWFVEIGINPCCKAWLPENDFDRLVERCEEIGVDGYYLQALQLREIEYNAMNEARRSRIPLDEVSYSFGKKTRYDYLINRYRKMYDDGRNAFAIGSPVVSRLMDDEVKFLGKGINSVQSFVNFAWDENARSGKTVFTIDDFFGVMFRGNEEMFDYESKDIFKYIMVIDRQLWKNDNRVKSMRTFKQLYSTVWNYRQLYLSIQNRECFALITDDGKRPHLDDFGNVMLYFLGRDDDMKRSGLRSISVDDLGGKGVKLP